MIAIGGFLIGILLGIGGALAWVQPQLAREGARLAALSQQLAAAKAAESKLAELQAQLSSLRHDVRGILSPALLVSDRLLSHPEPHVRRAGEVMVRTVERAAARLTETRLEEEAAASAQI